MKNRKWIVSILLAVVMIGGCGKDQGTEEQQIQAAEMTQTGIGEPEASEAGSALSADTADVSGSLSSSQKDDEIVGTVSDTAGDGAKNGMAADVSATGKDKSGADADSSFKTSSNAKADGSGKKNAGTNDKALAEKNAGSKTNGENQTNDSISGKDADSSKSTASEDNAQAGQGGAPSAHTSCVWDSGRVAREPACNAQGQKVYTCTVCGAAKAENIPYSSHHFVTETTESTCTEAGKSKTYCSDCGTVQAETTVAATGHSMTTQWFGEPPTCTRGGYQTVICSTCGWVDANACGDVPPLGHDTVGSEIQHGNCREDTIIIYTCSRCGEQTGFDRHNEPEDHKWVWKEDSIWDDETNGFVTIRVECCERCNARP